MQLLKINATNTYLLMSNVYSILLSETSIFQNAIYPMICFFFINVVIVFNKHQFHAYYVLGIF